MAEQNRSKQHAGNVSDKHDDSTDGAVANAPETNDNEPKIVYKDENGEQQTTTVKRFHELIANGEA